MRALSMPYCVARFLHAGGAGILGVYMLVCGFFQPVDQLPDPVWRYPMHYISFHSYAFAGFMRNE